MSSSEIGPILQVYEQLAQIPSLNGARTMLNRNAITIRSYWTQRNLERRKKQKIVQDFHFDTDLNLLAEGYPSDISSEILTAFTKNDELRAILRDISVDGKSKPFIEIWDHNHPIKTYDLSAFDVHGKVYTDSAIGSFQWSIDGKKLLYLAEKKLPKPGPFYKQKSNFKVYNSENADSLKGAEYVYKPDWGETLVGKHRSIIVILNTEYDTIATIDLIPKNYFPAQVTWAPNGNDIVGVVYKIDTTRYLGLYACTNRDSYIFHLKEGNFSLLTADNYSCRSPRFDPNGKYLVWLERQVSAAHHHVHRLMYIEWDVSEIPEVLVDIVPKHIIIDQSKKFYGIYCPNLPNRCWSDDSKFLFFSTAQRSNIRSYFVNLDTKLITQINDGKCSLSVLDVKQDYLICSRTSLILPTQMVVGKFEIVESNIQNVVFKFHTTRVRVPDGENLIYKFMEHVIDSDDTVNDFNFTYLGKKERARMSVPLVASPHGGPHMNFCNEFNIIFATFALSGFGVLLINYRGSTGMGGDNVDYILGKVGQSDVRDCLTAINLTYQKYTFLDPRNLYLYGGSHGGFINAHLSGKYPFMFNAVVMRNPVIDLAVLFSTSDIPDWCPAESAFYTKIIPENILPDQNRLKIMESMEQCSPLLYADKVVAPTLIALGSNDLRVPASQGKLWYHRLSEFNRVNSKLLLYEDNHSLSKDEVEIDFLLNSVLWFLEHKNNRREYLKWKNCKN